jgi:hypothetical protein
MRKRESQIFLVVALVSGCKQSGSESKGSAGWLQGTNEEKFELVAKHLRGFDMAMVGTDHRYTELYWAGQDENWGYAAYQTRKIRTAITNGVERRPKRAKSAQMIEPALNGVQEAIEAGDADLFWERFESLTATCNTCHQAEDVSFVKVTPPVYRASPVRATENNRNQADDSHE